MLVRRTPKATGEAHANLLTSCPAAQAAGISFSAYHATAAERFRSVFAFISPVKSGTMIRKNKTTGNHVGHNA
jgi:hypothetical protein